MSECKFCGDDESPLYKCKECGELYCEFCGSVEDKICSDCFDYNEDDYKIENYGEDLEYDYDMDY
jgi:hypothetical protein